MDFYYFLQFSTPIVQVIKWHIQNCANTDERYQLKPASYNYLIHCGAPTSSQPRHHQIYRNMLFLTLRFMVFGLPSSYSIPAAPPSPDICSSFSRSSSSAWATDLRFAGWDCGWLLFECDSESGDCWLLELDLVESSSVFGVLVSIFH